MEGVAAQAETLLPAPVPLHLPFALAALKAQPASLPFQPRQLRELSLLVACLPAAPASVGGSSSCCVDTAALQPFLVCAAADVPLAAERYHSV
jgi:hypothetical protein